ncbi:MAG TPA: hypothetical protein VFU40_06165 [Gemmatimonadales bacterium]|nr:hypothetical protein [Gemmatimonadales bacterium]
MRTSSYAWLVHPFLISAYFVLALAGANATALKGLRDLVWPLSTALLICTLAWVLALAFGRKPDKASLLSLLWMVAFSLFGYVAEALGVPGILRVLGGEAGLVALFGVGLLGPSLAIRRTTRSLEPVNRYFTLVAALLVAYTAVQLSRGLHRERDLRILLPTPPTLVGPATTAELPDIYLIILDKYTGSELLAEHFGFDNGGFEALLRHRGFVVPRHSRANYPQTQLALAAMLNLDYVQKLPRQVHLYDLIENNRLAAFLKLQGYRFVFFPSGFKVTSQNRNADLQVPVPNEVRGELGAVWQRTTMLPELVSLGCAVLQCRAGRLGYVPESAGFMDWKLERIGELAGGGQSTFVLAHLALPHEPYLYHADCRHREAYWPAGAGVLGDEKATKGYLEQIGCVNLKLIRLVDSILARSTRPPVILLQADHGHGRQGRHLPEPDRLEPFGLRERMSVFAAYLLPGVAAQEVKDSITPVNAMRLVLRHYFAADLPPLEDAGYWSTEGRPFDFVRVR